MKTLIKIFFISLSFSAFTQEIEKDTMLFERIAVLPNPTSEILFIKNGDAITSYKLIDSQGKVVQESKNNPQIISLIDEQIGTYFLILEIQGNFKSYRVAKY